MNIYFNADFPTMHNPANMAIAMLQIPGIHLTGPDEADVIFNVDAIHKVGLKRGKVTIYYEHDDMLHKGRNTQYYDVDLLYITSPHALSYYPTGTKVLPTAMEPTLHYRWDEMPVIFDLGFLGQEMDIPLYQYRRQILDILSKNFKMLRAQCQPQDYFKYLSQAKMPVNILPTQDVLPLINMRFYESLNVGCLLNNYHPVLDDMAEVGVHYVGFESPEDAVEKAKYYLAHDDEREKIYQQGKAHVLAHHTWKHRMLQVLKDVEGLPKKI